MKTQIENPILKTSHKKIKSDFNWIVRFIKESKDENDLRETFKHLIFSNFIFGFGGHHMWVKIRGQIQDHKRVLIVTF